MRRNIPNHKGHRIELSSRPNEQTNDVGAVKKMSKGRSYTRCKRNVRGCRRKDGGRSEERGAIFSLAMPPVCPARVPEGRVDSHEKLAMTRESSARRR